MARSGVEILHYMKEKEQKTRKLLTVPGANWKALFLLFRKSN
jgi:hypothetical protein